MNIKQNELNFFTETLRRENYKGTESHQLLVNARGNEKVVGVRRIQKIMKEFEEEDRKGFQRQDGSSKSSSSTGAKNVAIVRDLIEDNNMLSSLCYFQDDKH